MRTLTLLLIVLLAGCALAEDTSPPPDSQADPPDSALPNLAQDTPTPQGEVLDAAPKLLDPVEGASLDVSEGVRLAWVWHRNLQPGEYFEVLVARPGGVLQRVSLSQSNVLNVTDWFLPQRPGVFAWTVRVIKERQQGSAERQISFSADEFTLEVTGMQPPESASSPPTSNPEG
ncbi:MAG: hypothetical protein K8J31_28500 [Anaerolineae bacterium]|nr:hypothetical protein [Anaerolineae bacterium]